MSVVIRGIKNASRNWIRTGAVVLILAFAIGLALSMLVANEAISGRINSLREGIGNRLFINPAGAFRFQGGGDPLTTESVDKVKQINTISQVDSFINFSLNNTAQAERDQQRKNGEGIVSIGGNTSSVTNLLSSVDAGVIGKQNLQVEDNEPFLMPISGLGISGNRNIGGKEFPITSGRALNSSDTNTAIIGKDLAAKNNLAVGGTFTAFDETFTVVGIFDLGTKFENDQLAIPLATAQRVTEREGTVGMMVAQVNSIDNIATATKAIEDALGDEKIDVTAPDQNLQTTIENLRSVQNVSFIAFIGTLIAAAIITFMMMFVIVRERRREIGVLKSIGGSSWTIVRQFMVEAMVIVLIAGTVGTGLAFAGSGLVAKTLVSSSSNQGSSNTPSMPQVGRGGGNVMTKGITNSFSNPQQLIGTVTTSVGWSTIAAGVISTLIIAIVGSAVPAWFIAKIRPAEVLRGE